MLTISISLCQSTSTLLTYTHPEKTYDTLEPSMADQGIFDRAQRYLDRRPSWSEEPASPARPMGPYEYLELRSPTIREPLSPTLSERFGSLDAALSDRKFNSCKDGSRSSEPSSPTGLGRIQHTLHRSASSIDLVALAQSMRGTPTLAKGSSEPASPTLSEQLSDLQVNLSDGEFMNHLRRSPNPSPSPGLSDLVMSAGPMDTCGCIDRYAPCEESSQGTLSDGEFLDKYLRIPNCLTPAILKAVLHEPGLTGSSMPRVRLSPVRNYADRLALNAAVCDMPSAPILSTLPPKLTTFANDNESDALTRTPNAACLRGGSASFHVSPVSDRRIASTLGELPHPTQSPGFGKHNSRQTATASHVPPSGSPFETKNGFNSEKSEHRQREASSPLSSNGRLFGPRDFQLPMPPSITVQQCREAAKNLVVAAATHDFGIANTMSKEYLTGEKGHEFSYLLEETSIEGMKSLQGQVDWMLAWNVAHGERRNQDREVRDLFAQIAIQQALQNATLEKTSGSEADDEWETEDGGGANSKANGKYTSKTKQPVRYYSHDLRHFRHQARQNRKRLEDKATRKIFGNASPPNRKSITDGIEEVTELDAQTQFLPHASDSELPDNLQGNLPAADFNVRRAEVIENIRTTEASCASMVRTLSLIYPPRQHTLTLAVP